MKRQKIDRRKWINPVAEFSIYPKDSKHGLFALVFVYKNNNDLRLAVEQFGVTLYGKKIGACTQETTCYFPNGKRTACFAWLYLSNDQLSEETLVHECGHLALSYSRRMKFDAYKDEESFCYPLGILFKQLFSQLQKHKIILP